MKKLYIIAAIVLLFLFSCEEESIEEQGMCGPFVSIRDDFETVSSAQHNIIGASITGHCLEVEISSSGCDGESWVANMIASPLVAESYPPQVYLKIAFNNIEVCDAVVRKTYQYDLQTLNSISDKMYLHIEGLDDALLYLVDTNLAGTWTLINVNGGLLGTNVDFNSGDITWTFDAQEVMIGSNNSDMQNYTGFENGTYDYEIKLRNYEPYLSINQVNLGRITEINSNSLVIDNLPVDGFQFTLRKFE